MQVSCVQVRGVDRSILAKLPLSLLEANQHGDFALFPRPARAVLRWATFSAGRRFTVGFQWHGHQVHDGGALSLCLGDRQSPCNGCVPGPMRHRSRATCHSRAKDTCSQAGYCFSMAADGIRGAASLPALCPRPVFACQQSQAAPFEFLGKAGR